MRLGEGNIAPSSVELKLKRTNKRILVQINSATR